MFGIFKRKKKTVSEGLGLYDKESDLLISYGRNHKIPQRKSLPPPPPKKNNRPQKVRPLSKPVRR